MSRGLDRRRRARRLCRGADAERQPAPDPAQLHRGAACRRRHARGGRPHGGGRGAEHTFDLRRQAQPRQCREPRRDRAIAYKSRDVLMPARRYLKPPITEAVIECRFGSALPQPALARFVRNVMTEYPAAEETYEISVQLQVVAVGQKSEAKVEQSFAG